MSSPLGSVNQQVCHISYILIYLPIQIIPAVCRLGTVVQYCIVLITTVSAFESMKLDPNAAVLVVFSSFSLMASMWTWYVWFRTQTVIIIFSEGWWSTSRCFMSKHVQIIQQGFGSVYCTLYIYYVSDTVVPVLVRLTVLLPKIYALCMYVQYTQISQIYNIE